MDANQIFMKTNEPRTTKEVDILGPYFYPCGDVETGTRDKHGRKTNVNKLDNPFTKDKAM